MLQIVIPEDYVFLYNAENLLVEAYDLEQKAHVVEFIFSSRKKVQQFMEMLEFILEKTT